MLDQDDDMVRAQADMRQVSSVQSMKVQQEWFRNCNALRRFKETTLKKTLGVIGVLTQT